jgi:hypothetical protein
MAEIVHDGNGAKRALSKLARQPPHVLKSNYGFANDWIRTIGFTAYAGPMLGVVRD